MPRAKRSPAAHASRSGSYVHESQRHTERVVLRLPPSVADALRRRAAREEMTIASYVARLIQQDAQIE